MRIAFISDIHGNATALEAVLKDLEKRNIDKTFVLGDISFRGPEPKRSLNMIQSLKTEVIKGNADEWIIRGINEGEVPDSSLAIMNQEREWTVSKLSETHMTYLQGLPTELNLAFDNIKIHAFHATPNSLFDVVHPFSSDETLIEKLLVKEADIYIYAHIHKPYIRYLNGKCVINTGSVGLPFDGMNQSSYVIIDLSEDQLKTSIIRVEYDVNHVIQQFIQSDYPNKKLMNDLLENSGI
jgi:putative phosphoesterase